MNSTIPKSEAERGAEVSEKEFFDLEAEEADVRESIERERVPLAESDLSMKLESTFQRFILWLKRGKPETKVGPTRGGEPRDCRLGEG